LSQEQLVAVITLALTDSKSADLRLRLLSLVEFMEHEDKALPINNRTLGDIAASTFAMAKALHFKEHEYLSNPSVAVVEQLIGINASLKQQDAALGLLNSEMIGQRVNPVLWYEQLDRWEDASVEYADRIAHSPDDQDAIIGRLKCLHALNEWDALGQGVEQRWPSASPELRATLAPFAAASAWVLRQWDRMDQYVAAMTSATTERSFFKAIVSVHNNQFETAASHIGKARDALVMELGSIDDYNRVYS
jgi:serine/threonine-protein kinase mTOR